MHSGLCINGVLVGAGGAQEGARNGVIYCAGFWGVGEDAESPTSKAGMCSDSWQVCAGGLRFLAGRGAYGWESTVGHLAPQNEELQPRETSNPEVQPGLYSQRRCGCAQAVLQGEVTAGCTQPALGVWEVTAGCSQAVPHGGVARRCARSLWQGVAEARAQAVRQG